MLSAIDPVGSLSSLEHSVLVIVRIVAVEFVENSAAAVAAWFVVNPLDFDGEMLGSAEHPVACFFDVDFSVQ